MHLPNPFLVAALAVVGALVPVAARTTPTDPTLAIVAADAPTGAATRLVRLDGALQGEDLVQLAYPLQLLVRETTTGTSYVRYDLSAGAFTGSSAALADGLDAGEVVTLLSQGAPSADADVVFVGRERLEVRLPASFPAGPAEVQLFVLDEGEAVLSNAFPVVVGALP